MVLCKVTIKMSVQTVFSSEGLTDTVQFQLNQVISTIHFLTAEGFMAVLFLKVSSKEREGGSGREEEAAASWLAKLSSI